MLDFVRTRAVGLTDLLAKRKYGKAIDLVRQDLAKRPNDLRLRLRLADALVLAGRPAAAVPLLLELADDLALSGAAARAIALLKRAQSLEPGQPDVEERLAYLIGRETSPSADPWERPRPNPPLFDMEEIPDDELGLPPLGGSVEAPPVIVPPPSSSAIPPPAPQAAPLDTTDVASPAERTLSIDEFADEVMALVEDVLTERRAKATAELSGVPVVETPLFRDFTSEELVAVIRGLELRAFEPGEIVVAEGEPGDSLFVITSGTARTYVRNSAGRNSPVRIIEEGEIFGEVSLLENEVRTATITAATHLEILEINHATLDEIAITHPRIWDVIRRFYQERSGSDREMTARAKQA